MSIFGQLEDGRTLSDYNIPEGVDTRHSFSDEFLALDVSTLFMSLCYLCLYAIYVSTLFMSLRYLCLYAIYVSTLFMPLSYFLCKIQFPKMEGGKTASAQ
jgi:hypothetical protein